MYRTRLGGGSGRSWRFWGDRVKLRVGLHCVQHQPAGLLLNSTSHAHSDLSIGSESFLGLLVGALLIPYWKSLPGETFISLHKEYGPRLFRFFLPLTIAGTFVPPIASVVALFAEPSPHRLTVLSGIFSDLLITIYFF